MSEIVTDKNGTCVVKYCGPANDGKVTKSRLRYEIQSTGPLTREELRELVAELITELDEHGPDAGCPWCHA